MALTPLPGDWRRCLAVVAHPDDLEFGVSSAIARWTAEGKEVVEVLATRGEAGIETLAPEACGPLRTAEQIRAAASVGVETVEFLDWSDGTLTNGLELRRDLARVIRRHRPDVIVSINHREGFGAGSVNHADHRALGSALLDAVRDAANRWVFRELLAAGHEPHGGVQFVAFGASSVEDHFVDVTSSLERGIEALRAHATYLAALAGDFDIEGFLRRNAEEAGRRSGVPLAVTFEVLRP